MEALGHVLAAEQTRERQEDAAVLLAAADTRWQALGIDPLQVPALGSRHETERTALRALLGERVYGERARRGGRLSHDQALTLAVEGRLVEEPKVPAQDQSPLTPRESEVADLVGQGLANREIAERLVISHRTAQGHVENILHKLGFSSRAQVAAWVAERHARTEQGQTG
jgi:non-specific serine/threonine protein kinase